MQPISRQDFINYGSRTREQAMTVLNDIHLRRIRARFEKLISYKLPLHRTFYEPRIMARCTPLDLDEFGSDLIGDLDMSLIAREVLYGVSIPYNAAHLVAALVKKLLWFAEHNWTDDLLEAAYDACCELPRDVIEDPKLAVEVSHFMHAHIEMLMLLLEAETRVEEAHHDPRCAGGRRTLTP